MLWRKPSETSRRTAYRAPRLRCSTQGAPAGHRRTARCLVPATRQAVRHEPNWHRVASLGPSSGVSSKERGRQVELEGIEPSSVERSSAALRPFPRSSLGGRLAAGSAAVRHRRVFPRCQRSFPSPAVSPCCPPLLLLPGCSGQAPRAIAGRDVSHHLTGWESGGESEVAIGASLGAPFKESEQLRSHERLPVPTSKPVSPLSRYALPGGAGPW